MLNAFDQSSQTKPIERFFHFAEKEKKKYENGIVNNWSNL